MHELSIATALLEQVRRHAPAGAAITRVKIEAGPLQGINPEAMRFAWRSVTEGGDLREVDLDIAALPWHIRCDTCQRTWTSEDMFDRCTCGSEETYPTGSDELRLIALEVEPGAARVARN